MKRIACVVLSLGLLASPTLAHHSVKAGHDTTRLVTIKGTVEKVTWTNPHAAVVLSVKKDNGQTETQRIQFTGPGGLAKIGFSADLLKVGDVVSFDVWMPTMQGSGIEGRALTLADGRRFDVGDNWGERGSATLPAR